MASTSRIDQWLSRCGYCSRREARGWVRQGRVRVGDALADSAEQRVPGGDVWVDGEPLEAPEGLLVLLNKPGGRVCSHQASEGPSIYDLLPERWLRRNPAMNSVGRLDQDTTGVLLLTDLGDLIQRWTSPRHKVPKVYEVTVDQPLDDTLVPLFANGTLQLPGEDSPCAPARLQIVDTLQARLELTEGRFHQVKRRFGATGRTVTRLHRSRFGEIELGDLKPGKWRLLNLPEITRG